ncbi:MAG: PEP-CTERM sorting domain-containing protein [Aquabacterium sp.]|nr:MAG: PEP-CTERM sorting domain-containing protein [Aquabacterium sp.]
MSARKLPRIPCLAPRAAPLAAVLMLCAASPAHAAPQADYHWFIDGAYGTVVDGSVLKGGKALRTSSFTQGLDPTKYQFQIRKWEGYLWPDSVVTTLPYEAFTVGTNNWYRSNASWLLPAGSSKDWYYFYAIGTDGTYYGYSPYVVGSDTATAITVDSVEFNVNGSVEKGIGKVEAGANAKSTKTVTKVTVDPAVDYQITFLADPLSYYGSALDPDSATFMGWSALQGSSASQAPAGWDIHLQHSSLSDGAFTGSGENRSADNDLIVSADSSTLGQIVAFAIVARTTMDTGEVSYSGTPVLAYQSIGVVPEPEGLALFLAGGGMLLVQLARRRRSS